MKQERLTSFVYGVAMVLRLPGQTAVTVLKRASRLRLKPGARPTPARTCVPTVGSFSPKANATTPAVTVQGGAKTRQRNGGNGQGRPCLFDGRVPPLNSRVLVLVLLAFFLTGCAVAVGPNAQANAGSIVANADDGSTAVIGVGNDVNTTVAPTAVPANSSRVAPMIVFLVSVTGLIIGIVGGLYLSTREENGNEKQPDFL